MLFGNLTHPQVPDSCWQSVVKATKKCFKFITKGRPEDALMTFLGKVKNTLNSLPLPLLDDLDNLCILTPNHFLLAKQPLYFNPTSIKGEHINSRRRWKAGQASSKRYRSVIKNVLETFIKEYLPILQTRKKWNKRQWNMPKKDIVIVMDDNIVAISKIIETFPGKNGIAWSVKLRCNKICSLEENGWLFIRIMTISLVEKCSVESCVKVL